jgi:hypothetical protein
MYPLKLRMIPPPPRPELPPLPREQQRLPTRYWANAQILFCAIRIHDSSQSPPSARLDTAQFIRFSNISG